MKDPYNLTHFNSRRSPVCAANGMVAASQPLATMAGVRTLLRGGNAADAAVATAAVLAVTEPHMTGLGGDAFALIYLAKEGNVRALNASGPAPQAARLADYRAKGLTEIPPRSPLAWTVPGCVDGWHQMVTRYGRLSLAEVLEPAIEYAERGFCVSPVDAGNWLKSEPLLREHPASRQTLLIDGRAPRPGEVFHRKELAQTLKTLAQEGRDAFYEGEIANRIVAYSQEQGGLFGLEDFAGYTAAWETPISINYHGYQVLECPPNGQGLAALLALQLVEDLDLTSMLRDSVECWHLLIEAIKQGLTDAMAYVADPLAESVPLDTLLSDQYKLQHREKMHRGKRASEVDPTVLPGYSNTVYLSVVDGDGNAVSFINSVYMNFGTGHTVPGLGFPLQNRGACFSLDPAHPNRLAPGKRPYHTIIPGMVLKDGRLAYSFGVMGGFMQPQGHLQVLVNLLDFGMDVQSAIDQLRFRWMQGRQVTIEEGVPEELFNALRTRGHLVEWEGHGGFGGSQIIGVLEESGALVGGSEPRQDGCAFGY